MTPLFPLNTVLFPGGDLPLRIFEPRYLDMISDCLRNDTGFGICLIRSGSEVGGPAECYPVGTLARVSDWHSLPGGLLGITVVGGDRFRIRSSSAGSNNLLEGELEWLVEGDAPAMEEIGKGRYAWVPPLLEDVEYVQYASIISAGQLSYRLAERLGLSLARRQDLLERDGEYQRLDRIYELLQTNSQ